MGKNSLTNRNRQAKARLVGHPKFEDAYHRGVFGWEYRVSKDSEPEKVL